MVGRQTESASAMGGPEWITHFVNRDMTKFQETVRDLVRAEPGRKEIEGYAGDETGTIGRIAFGAAAGAMSAVPEKA